MTEKTGVGVWMATHRAPREGLDAWVDPDPSASPSSEVEARVELQVIDGAGAWARVRGENGWEGWVDGRLLEQIESGGGDRRAYILLGVAVAVLIVLAVLGMAGS